MVEAKDFLSKDPVAWCPGCGDFGILNAMKKALVKLGKRPQDVLLVSGIGQAAKLPHYVKCNCFNGLHGRSLPSAVAAKIVNRELTVIVSTGDGDCYGEGGNHFIHNIRRNADITVVVHDNQIYGLTKGQASPTTGLGQATKVQLQGVILEPLQPLALAIAMGAGFVARGFSVDSEHLAGLIVAGVQHRGFALIDVLQPCISFNKVNTYDWYNKRVYKIDTDQSYNNKDKIAAFQKALEWGDKIPLGIIYQTKKETYEDKCGLNQRPPLVQERIDNIDISKILAEFA